MKTMNETLTKIKGENKINQICTGKGPFSTSGFSDLVNSMVNDTTFKIKTFDKDGKPNGEVNVSELIRSDIKKTVEKAKYPQKSESGVFDNSEIVANGLAKAIPYIVMEHIACGKKFDLPQQPNVQGSIYLANVEGKETVSKVRDIKTGEDLGTSTTVTKDYIQVRAKSPAPASCIVSKVRKDPSGKVIE